MNDMACVAVSSSDGATFVEHASICDTALRRGSSSSRAGPGRDSAPIDRAILRKRQRMWKLTHADLSIVSDGGSPVRMIYPRRATESPETGRQVEAIRRRARRRKYDRVRRRTENDIIRPIEEESSLVGSDCDTSIVDQSDRFSMEDQSIRSSSTSGPNNIRDLNLFDELMLLHEQTIVASQKKSSPFRIVRDENGYYRSSRIVSRRRNSECLPRPNAEEEQEQERRQSVPASDNVIRRKKFQPRHRRPSINEKIQGIVKPSKYLSRESSPALHEDEISNRTAKTEALDISTRSEGWIPCGVEFSENAEVFVIEGIDRIDGYDSN